MSIGPVFQCRRDEFIAFVGILKSQGFTLTDSNGKESVFDGVLPEVGSFTVRDRKGQVTVRWETDKPTDASVHVLLAYSAPLIWLGRNHRLAKTIESHLTTTLSLRR